MISPEAAGDEQDQIDLQASEWVVQMSDRLLTDDERDELTLWLGADPRHRLAFRGFENLWANIPALPALNDVQSEAPERTVSDPEVSVASKPRDFSFAWPAAASLAAIAATFAGFLIVPRLAEHEQTYQTGVSQTQMVSLEDGSRITLGPKSSLTARFHGADRRVALLGGEAFFEVVHNPSRPFYVDAGGAQTKVLGTKFDVNYAGGSVRVGVAEGLVQVSRKTDETQTRSSVVYLRAGQGAEIAPAGAQGVIVARTVQAPGAWRDGRLSYDDSRLADLVADANRYYAPGVAITDPKIGDLRITASFKPGEIAAFMATVGEVVPVDATQAPDGSFRIGPPGPRSGPIRN